MSKKIVISVMLIDEKSQDVSYSENVGVDPEKTTQCLSAIQTWVSEQVICAKLEAVKLSFKS